MKITSAELMGQAHVPAQILSVPFPQVAVFGRSNVGKSSLLAGLVVRKRLVRISSTPGKTRAIYYYLVNGKLVLVDLPGYGFSKAPRSVARAWQDLILAYLEGPSPPDLALHLVDIRHPPSREDLEVSGLIAKRRIPFLVAATKADKLSRSGQLRAAALIARDMGVPSTRVVPVSTLDRRAPIGALWERIVEELGAVG